MLLPLLLSVFGAVSGTPSITQATQYLQVDITPTIRVIDINPVVRAIDVDPRVSSIDITPTVKEVF